QSEPLPPEAIVHELADAELTTTSGVLNLLATLGLDFGIPVEFPLLGLHANFNVETESHPPLSPIIEGLSLGDDVLGAIVTSGPGTTLGMLLPAAESDDGFEIDLWCGHWQHVAERMRLVRAAVNHFVAHREGRDLTQAWTDEGFTPEVDNPVIKRLKERQPAL